MWEVREFEGLKVGRLVRIGGSALNDESGAGSIAGIAANTPQVTERGRGAGAGNGSGDFPPGRNRGAKVEGAKAPRSRSGKPDADECGDAARLQSDFREVPMGGRDWCN